MLKPSHVASNGMNRCHGLSTLHSTGYDTYLLDVVCQDADVARQVHQRKTNLHGAQQREEKSPTSLLVESRQPQDGEGHLCKAIEHEHDEGEEDHAEVELAL